MAFQFSLQEVLEYRQRLEETAQAEMQEVRQRVEYVEDLINQAQDRRTETRREMDLVMQESRQPGHEQLYEDYLSGLDNLINQSRQHLEQLREELERRRRKLADASRQRQVMSELKKGEYKQYQLEERREEIKTFDEIASRNFLLKSREKSSTSGEPKQ
jgi:flagellar FliJ protein